MKIFDSIKEIGFIKIQPNDYFDDFRYAGKITADCLSLLEGLVSSKTSKSLIELNQVAEDYFLSKNVNPIFKGYHGFPAAVCCSVNKQLVHSIPTDYVLQDGDIVTFDTGCSYKNGIADSAVTCIFGEPKDKRHIELVETTQKCLYNAIKSISINNRIGVIGNSIFNTARKNGFKVIENYSGHGISDQVHSDPVILNKAEIDSGARIKSGMVLAIEPLLVLGNSTRTSISENNWDVMTDDLSAHYEHSILVNDTGVEVLTLRENENRIS